MRLNGEWKTLYGPSPWISRSNTNGNSMSCRRRTARLMKQGYHGPLLNIGTGTDVTIRELAELVMKVVGFEGEIVFYSSKPDGTP